jgi:integrase
MQRSRIMRHDLTAARIESIKPPAHGQAEYFDRKVPGFGLRVSQGGRRAWVLLYRHEGRLRRLTLGTYPILSLADARDLAKDKLADAQKGADPATEKAELREQATWAELQERYFTDYAKARKRSWREDERLLKRYLPVSWPGRKLSGIGREEIIRLHANIGRENGMSAANHLLRLLRSMLNLARDWQMLREENPATKIRFFKESPRERFLTADEIRRLNQALAEEPNPYWRAFFALSLLLGTRRSELLTGRWEMIDWEARVLNLPVTKAGRPHVVTLPEAAIAILKSLPSCDATGWIFPSATGRAGHLTEPKAAWKRIRENAKIENCRPHDLRHSLASLLVQQGYGLALVGRILNHSQLATTQRYSHLALDSMRDALEQASSIVLGNGISSKQRGLKPAPKRQAHSIDKGASA